MGYGSQLMQKAEALAREKQCHFISVNTMDFEALRFYQKLGFYIEFSRHGYNENSVFHFMRKDLIVFEDTQSTKLGLLFEYQKHSEYFDVININENTEQINALIESILKQNQVKTVFDLTCGTSFQIFFLTKFGYQCTGADFSPDLLKQARLSAESAGQDKCPVLMGAM